MEWGTVEYVLHIVVGPSLLFIAGALANYAFTWFKQRAQKERLFISPDEAQCLMRERQDKCAILFTTAGDLEKMHRTILDEIYEKFATREAVKKIEETMGTMHDDFKTDMKDIKDQLHIITTHLMRGRYD